VIYFFLGTMLLVAVLAIALPLYRQEQRVSTNSALAIAIVLLISVSVYKQIGSPGAETLPSGAAAAKPERPARMEDARPFVFPDAELAWRNCRLRARR
jgi:hypothetical protein